MSLSNGTRVGPYEVVSMLGAGGMGEVYRARDTRLDRTVALKVLPAELSQDPERRTRFEREARAIASLTHPHICTLYDVGSHEGIEFLVMELLEGETLGARLARGRLDLDECLRYAIAIAEALEAAHQRGIVHRDLKPANVMLTRAGVKLLDFGLAKLRAEQPAVVDGPTNTALLTSHGQILGTLQYMAPEQLQGREVDPRADLFAFGAMLFEMVTGRRAFEGDSPASVIGAILHTTPPPVTTNRSRRTTSPRTGRDPLPCTGSGRSMVVGARRAAAIEGGHRRAGRHATGSRSRRANAPPASPRVGRCGRADPRRGCGAGVVRVESNSSGANRTVCRTGVGPAPARHRAGRRRGAPDRARRPSGRLRGDGPLRAVGPVRAQPGHARRDASARDGGRRAALLGSGQSTTRVLRPRPAQNGRACGRTAPGARAGSRTAWRHLESGRRHRVRAATEPPGPSDSSAAGGPAVPVPTEAGDNQYRWFPHFLPDGRHYLFVAGRSANRAIRIGTLDSADTRELVASKSNAVFVAPNTLLYRTDATLVSQALDSRTLQLVGQPKVVLENLGFNAITYQALFSAAADGPLVWLTNEPRSELVWFDRAGKRAGVAAPAGHYAAFCLAQRDQLVVFEAADPVSGNVDLWAVAASGGTASRLTFDPAVDFFPVCSPSGAEIVFSTLREGPPTCTGWH